MASINNTAAGQRQPAIAWNRFVIAALVAILGSVAVNAVIYFIAAALGAMPETVTVPGPDGTGRPITVVPVALLSAQAALVGSIVYAVLARVSRRPERLFISLSIIVVVVWFFPPLTLNAPVAMLIALNVMHIAAAVVTVLALTRLTRKPA